MIFNSPYILKVLKDGETYIYEYITKRIVDNHYDFEKSCTMYKYINGNYHFIKAK
jgi:hypothetical protein